jgi:hypothetical protein
MAGRAPLETLRKLAVVEGQARLFPRGSCQYRRGGSARGQYRFRGGSGWKTTADAIFARDIGHFPGRLGITHRDVPEAVARGCADVRLTQYHLISYWVQTFPNHFVLVPIDEAERFAVKIGFAGVTDPPRPRALAAFEEFLFGQAREVYPRCDFAQMSDQEFEERITVN